MSLINGPWESTAPLPSSGRQPAAHPSEETIAAAVCGQLDLPHRLVVMTHVELCSACRELQAELASPGGALLDGLATEEAPPASIWSRIESALDASPRAVDFEPALPIPPAVRLELVVQPRPRWWAHLLNGGRMAVLLDDPATGTQLCIGELPGGRRFPRHLHLGSEQATVLAGGYEDERGSFEAGDYVEYEPGSEHGPDTLDGDPCWILFRLQGKVRFRGWRGLIQRLVP